MKRNDPGASLSRREVLRRSGGGFGSVALAALLADQALPADQPTRCAAPADPLCPRRALAGPGQNA